MVRTASRGHEMHTETMDAMTWSRKFKRATTYHNVAMNGLRFEPVRTAISDRLGYLCTRSRGTQRLVIELVQMSSLDATHPARALCASRLDGCECVCFFVVTCDHREHRWEAHTSELQSLIR